MDEVFFDTICQDLGDEIARAQEKFPKPTHLTVALMEEVGELAEAQLKGKSKKEIYDEAIQVMAVAARIIMEGDADLAGANEDGH
jgi:NTP pyrophosphatase (non-canonical NTP hydrolase)